MSSQILWPRDDSSVIGTPQTISTVGAQNQKGSADSATERAPVVSAAPDGPFIGENHSEVSLANRVTQPKIFSVQSSKTGLVPDAPTPDAPVQQSELSDASESDKEELLGGARREGDEPSTSRTHAQLSVVPGDPIRPRRSRRRRGTAEGGRGAFTSLSRESILSSVWHRISLLVSLLLFQSLSQFILERYETLLSHHVIVPLFLTMLVGAGGNAGNQSAVRSITGLVSGEFSSKDFFKVIRKEIVVGFINSFIVAAIGFSRVYYFYGHRNLFWSTIAITVSLFCIVFSSVLIGTSLPFLLGRFGYDREHAAPMIQVIMDIIGVLITCVLCTHMIPASEHTKSSS